MNVIPLVETDVTTSHKTDVTTSTSTDPSVHTDGGFPGGSNDCSVLTGYADHVAFIL